MDLLEIRKKAKKLKAEGNAGPEPIEEAAEAPAAPEEGTRKAKTAAAKTAGRGKVVKSPAPEPPPLEEEGEEATEEEQAEVFLPVSAGKEEGDFLSSVMDALYQEGYDEIEAQEEDRLELLCFMLSDEEYAVDINDVREIIKMAEVTEVPKTPHYLLGIISLRGVIIPLLDLRMRIGLEAKPYDGKTRIIIAAAGENRMGMVVDSVTEVVRLGRGVLESPPTLLANVNADLLQGVGRHEERLLIIPNLPKVFDITI